MKNTMNRAAMITEILQDMYSKNPNESTKTIDKRWKGWLNRQDKATLENIYTTRILKAYDIAAGI